MKTLETKKVAAVYVSPELECSDLLVEGVLCQSMPQTATTEEWDHVDLSGM